jgi:hypothetical protein
VANGIQETKGNEMKTMTSMIRAMRGGACGMVFWAGAWAATRATIRAAAAASCARHVADTSVTVARAPGCARRP